MTVRHRPGLGMLTLVGDGLPVPCVDGRDRPYLNLDAAASTSALGAVARAIEDFLPWYSSVHRGAGYKSQRSTDAYEAARAAALCFAGRAPGGNDVAIICRNATEAINHLAYRLRLAADDVVATTVVEHHANMLPWARLCRRRFVECGPDGTFTAGAVAAALDGGPRPRLLAVTGASNVTGWLPPVDEIIATAHERGVPVLVDAAQLAPHRPLPAEADFLAWSGHKMYAPFGAGVLVGPRAAFAEGDPFLAGGGAVDLVDLDEVAWTDPPDREEAGSPNVIGAVGLHAAIEELGRIGWDTIIDHDARAPPAAARRAGRDPRRGRARPRPGRPGPTAGDVHRHGHTPRARRRPAQRRARHRCPPRLLLRPPLPGPPAQARHRRHRPVLGRGAPPRPPPHAGRHQGQRRTVHDRRRHRPAGRRGGRHRLGPTGPP